MSKVKAKLEHLTCLIQGGTLARCGLVEDQTGLRNYDTPRNALGEPMQPNIQATWVANTEVVLDVTLTAHHGGHFVFSGCPISPGEVPTQECFDRNQLQFVSDELYGANLDVNYPERAYIAPVMNNPGYVIDTSSPNSVMEFSFKMKLPPALRGELVLIQWYYLTGEWSS